ncbi:hypothetical protein [Luteimonas sp. A478]
MAIESVTTSTAAQTEIYDQINELTLKAIGIMQVIRAASLEDLPDDAIHYASWAAEGLLYEVRGLLDQ